MTNQDNAAEEAKCNQQGHREVKSPSRHCEYRKEQGIFLYICCGDLEVQGAFQIVLRTCWIMEHGLKGTVIYVWPPFSSQHL